jgi:hypothetical protein
MTAAISRLAEPAADAAIAAATKPCSCPRSAPKPGS